MCHEAIIKPVTRVTCSVSSAGIIRIRFEGFSQAALFHGHPYGCVFRIYATSVRLSR
jgi:hypothetical protein